MAKTLSESKTTEADKDAAQRAEDVAAYTINHALACTAADLLNPYIGNLTQTYLGKRVDIGCGHDHSIAPSPPPPPAPPAAIVKDFMGKKLGKGLFTKLPGSGDGEGYKRLSEMPCAPDCGHDHTLQSPAPTPTPVKSNLKHWWIGEIVGDFGAVPITVGMQRFAPGVMHSIRRVMEPVMAPLFHMGAKRSAKLWAEEKAIAENAPETQAQEDRIYEREMSHLPQAFVWTVSAAALNLATQRMTGNKGPISHLMAGKLAGAATSAALVVGFRGFAPHQAYRWDKFTSEHIFEPTARFISGNKSWQDRVNEEQVGERQI